MARSTTWSYLAGEKCRNRVRAFEDDRSGILFLEFYDSEDEGSSAKRKRLSTGHRDRERAKRQADELAAKIGRNEPLPAPELTLRTLFDNYLREVTPRKGKSKQQHDRRCAEMFLRCYGANRRPLTLAKREFDLFVNDRRSGRLAPAHVKKRRQVGNTQIGHDLKWIIAVFNWAVAAGDGRGGVLLQRNPFKGFRIPTEQNPRRPILREEQYQSLRRVANRVDPLFECVLTLAHETGHRISSIRQLRWSDVDLTKREIRWRRENDKIGNEHTTILTEAAVAALEQRRRESAAIGDSWVFPAARTPAKPLPRHTTIHWWKAAMKLADIKPVPGLGWHSLRRKFATELKDTPIKDLAQLGGWKSTKTVLEVYQQPDLETMRAALESRKVLRAADAAKS